MLVLTDFFIKFRCLILMQKSVWCNKLITVDYPSTELWYTVQAVVQLHLTLCYITLYLPLYNINGNFSSLTLCLNIPLKVVQLSPPDLSSRSLPSVGIYYGPTDGCPSGPLLLLLLLHGPLCHLEVLKRDQSPQTP